MEFDLEQLLRRVVVDSFDETVEATYFAHPKYRYNDRVRLSAEFEGQRRNAALWVSYSIFQADVSDLGVSTFEFVEEHDEAGRELALRVLASLVRAYLKGEGQTQQRRGLIRRHRVLKIAVDDQEWELRSPLFRRRPAP